MEFIGKSGKKTVMVFGSGPIRIGQGIEFDYASASTAYGRSRSRGYEVVIVNNNPETVSTDFDTADRLYFEPLYAEDVMNIIDIEKPYRRCRRLRRPDGHQAHKVRLRETTCRILGTSADSIDMPQRTASALTSCSNAATSSARRATPS